jgi:adenine-specific DNA-methyltransferase
MAADNFKKLKRLLEELFQLDQADLDFGIYRIMNQKRDEVVRFLDHDLLPQVKEAFGEYQSADTAEIRKDLDKLIAQINAAGMNPDDSPKVRELREKLESEGVDVVALENDVYSHLFSFFRRYYNEGDFISLRRYKEGVYAIPYEGEEVKLHWANHDQYYIKSSEYLRDYVFKLSSGKRVRVHLVSASTEQDNKKEAPGKERRFVLADDNPLYEENGELYIRFEFRTDDGKKKQSELNQSAIEAILGHGASSEFREWVHELAKKAPTGKNPDRTLLERHLSRYTARNTFDYFIHKDLGGFLRRELDFYIKNEVMHLDDIEHDSVPRVEQYLSKIKVIRKIAHKIIQFLEQLENFQKRIWMKKKFVINTAYCLTLDKISEEFYPAIAENDAQRLEWIDLFAINRIKGDLMTPGYTVPLTAQFLAAHSHLPVDTSHFEAPFRDRLLASLDSSKVAFNGLLVCGDSSHGLNLLKRSTSEKIKFFYLDPPYNTDSDDFLYKDSYQYSSWLAMMHDRLERARELLSEDGSIAVSIDQHSFGHLRALMDRVFGYGNLISTITVKRATVSGPKVINPGVVNVSDYALLYAKNRSAWIGNAVFSERDRDDRYSSYILNRHESHEKWEFGTLLDVFSEHMGVAKRRLRAELGDAFDEKIHDFVKEHAESVFQPCLVRPSNVSEDYRSALQESSESPDRVILFRRPGFSDTYLRNGKLLLFYSDKVKKVGERTITAERASDIWSDVLPNDLHNEGGVELEKGKKPESLISRLVALTTEEGDLVGDFLLGSGTLAAVAQKMRRNWIGIEMANYFESKPLRRCKNVLAGEQKGVSEDFGWNGGGAFKYVHLESYEDALNNLEFQRTSEQEELLVENEDIREQYLLSYMLDVESRGSQSLLNVDSFRNPNEYKLKIERNGETQLVNVDLVETFNWMLGLTIKHVDEIRGVRVVDGTSPDGERILVLWRNLVTTDNDALDAWFKKQGYNTREQDYDAIYVNGDNNLENLRRADQTWKVRLTEEHFHRLMFEDCDS